MFKQGAYNPVPVEVQTAVMWAMQNDFFDSIPVNKISEAVESLKEFLATQGKEACDEIYKSVANLRKKPNANSNRPLRDWKATFA